MKEIQMKTCINCGKTNPDAVEYCTCGYHFLSRGNENAEKIAQYISNSKITHSVASSGNTIINLARDYFYRIGADCDNWSYCRICLYAFT